MIEAWGVVEEESSSGNLHSTYIMFLQSEPESEVRNVAVKKDIVGKNDDDVKYNV